MPSRVQDATVIDGGGRTLMPGLIDSHVHLYWNVPTNALFYASEGYLTALALKEAENTLMRGYTGVRGTSGPKLGIKQAIDQGLYPGPRIWASEAGISMTSGHGDLKTNNTVPRTLGGPYWTDVEYSGFSIVADGVPEFLSATRLQLRKGAHFVKMYTSGAFSGLHDPLDISEYSFDEIKAAADEAKRWNTYLAVHTYNDAAKQRALKAVSNSLRRYSNMTDRLADNAGKVNAGVVRNLMDLRLFNDDGTFAENGGCTKPTKQDADLTSHQVVTDVKRREMWLKIPVPDYFADWTHVDVKALWAD